MGYITPWIAKILTQASKNFASGNTPLPFMGLRVKYLPTFRSNLKTLLPIASTLRTVSHETFQKGCRRSLKEYLNHYIHLVVTGAGLRLDGKRKHFPMIGYAGLFANRWKKSSYHSAVLH
jgi:hypothetical protein